MTILLNNNTTVLVQGITGYQGSFHTKKMLEYGTKIVAGVTPGKEGQHIHGIPVYNTVKKAVENHEIEASIIYVPAKFVKSATFEAIEENIPLIVIITEHIPIWDSAYIMEYTERKKIKIIGPNCPGLISPGKAKLGIIPGEICLPGEVGIVSRSGTLTYEVISQLTTMGIGQSTCVGIGGDPIHGLGFIEILQHFEEDPNTSSIVLLGEIGGSDEENAAVYIQKHISKPVVAFIAGESAPPGKQMGHAGAIISGSSGTASEKKKQFENVGVKVAKFPKDIPELLKNQDN